MKSVENCCYNYARGALRAFLEGAKTLNWFLGMVQSSGVQGARLAEIFESHRDYGNRQRYEAAAFTCRQRGWLL